MISSVPLVLLEPLGEAALRFVVAAPLVALVPAEPALYTVSEPPGDDVHIALFLPRRRAKMRGVKKLGTILEPSDPPLFSRSRSRVAGLVVIIVVCLPTFFQEPKLELLPRGIHE